MKNYTKGRLLPLLLMGIPSILFVIILGLIPVVNFLILHTWFTFSWEIIALDFILLVAAKITLDQAFKFIQGEWGEDTIGEILSELPKRRTVVLYNLMLNEYGNIDYIIIDTKGIAIIEVKSHSGHISFNGKKLLRAGKDLEKDFLKQIRGQAFDVQKAIKNDLGLDVSIQPIIVFSNRWSRMEFGMNPLRGTNILVVKSEWLNDVLLKRKGFFQDQDRVEQISSYLRQFCEK